MHELVTSTKEPQLELTLNGPLTCAADTLTDKLPVLLRVTVRTAELAPTTVESRLNELADRLTEDCVPLPLKDMFCVPAPVLIDKEPVATPMAVGVKVTLATQELPAANDAGQLEEAANAPVVLSEPTDSTVLPVLFKVTDCAAEVLPTAVLAKVKDPASVPAAVKSPRPPRLTFCVPTLVGMLKEPEAAPAATG